MNRREVFNAAAASLLFPAWRVDLARLRDWCSEPQLPWDKFCAAPHEVARYDLTGPFVQAGYQYGTDAKIMLRAAADAPNTEGDLRLPNAGETFDHFAQQEHGPWQPLTVTATRGDWVSCDQCDGAGWSWDPVTYHVQRCKHCNSNGSVWDRSAEVQIGGRWFMRQMSDLLLLLPRVEYRMPVENLHDGRPMHFRSGGAEGLLMPLTR